MKIGVGGCSHSSTGYGYPWHKFMGQRYSAKIIKSSTSGGGNEANVEKIKYIFDENPDLDFFVLQLTEPSRFVFGMEDFNNSHEKTDCVLDNPTFFNGVKYYTAVGNKNDERLKKRTNIDVKFDKLFTNHIYVSDYNTKYKFLHTLMSIQHLANHYNKKIIFFSWFVDVRELAQSVGYQHIIEKMIILEGYVLDFVEKNKIPPIPNDSHYDSDAHKIIFNDYIHPQLKELITITTKII
jgi:hypothetical protein